MIYDFLYSSYITWGINHSLLTYSYYNTHTFISVLFFFNRSFFSQIACYNHDVVSSLGDVIRYHYYTSFITRSLQSSLDVTILHHLSVSFFFFYRYSSFYSRQFLQFTFRLVNPMGFQHPASCYWFLPFFKSLLF